MRPQYQLQYATDPASFSDVSSEGKQAKILEQYPLNEPHAYAKIMEDPIRGTVSYLVMEPELSNNDKIQLKRLEELLIEVLEVNIAAIETRELAANYLLKQSTEIMKNHDFKMDNKTRDKILYYIVRDHIGFGKIDPMMRDPFVEDISCDGTNLHLYVWHRKYEYIPTNIIFKTVEELNSFASRLAYLCGSHISIAQPMLDASLPEGSRLHLTFGKEITRRGSTFTIRKFKLDPLTIIDLINYGTLSAEIAAYLWHAVENRASILVAGGIASGKTTLLNCLSMFIKPAMKIVTIEDTAELNLPHENWVPSITRSHFGVGTEQAEITLFDLLKSSLRQRPDHIIVGEVRGAEAYTLFQAISTGHLGMSTLHAESVEAAIYRLESEPMNIPRTLISGIDLITVQKRVERDGQPFRKTVATTEIVGLDPRSREILTNEVYKWSALTDKFDYTGRSYLLERNAVKNGLSMDYVNKEIKRRTVILKWMCNKNIRSYTDVSNVIQRFYENPKVVYAEAKKG
jgi:flagellar protein FlaI